MLKKFEAKCKRCRKDFAGREQHRTIVRLSAEKLLGTAPKSDA